MIDFDKEREYNMRLRANKIGLPYWAVDLAWKLDFHHYELFASRSGTSGDDPLRDDIARFILENISPEHLAG